MTTQPAGEHHTGTLNLTGQGNPEPNPYGITDELIQRAAEAVSVHPIDAQLITAVVAPAIRQHVAEQIAAKGNEIAERHSTSAADHRAIAIQHGTDTQKGQRHMRTALSFRDQAAGAWEVMHAAREIGTDEANK